MNNLDKAVQVLKQGGIIIFPTDTAFGIGCRIDNIDSVQKLFRIRRRPLTQAAPILVSSLDMAQKYLKPIPREVLDKLINPYWPGALTIILPCLIRKVPQLVRGGGRNLGIRIPDNKKIIFIIQELGIPVLGPSANFHGEKTPYSFKDLDQDLIKKVDYVIDGECKTKNSSTVIDCSVNPWKILRRGAVNL